jgi:hypothetical protein
MGKTVPSYRMALEFEIERWKGFKKALQSEEDKEAIEALMDMCRNNAMASGNACNPIIFEPMVMSILLAQQKSMQKLEYKLNEVQWQRICAQENNQTAHANNGEAPPEMKSKNSESTPQL